MLKELYNVAYGQRIDLNTLAASIMEITGISVPLVYEPSRVGDVWDSRVDIRRAEEAFGYTPAYTVKTGLEETIRWYQNQ